MRHPRAALENHVRVGAELDTLGFVIKDPADFILAVHVQRQVAPAAAVEPASNPILVFRDRLIDDALCRCGVVKARDIVMGRKRAAAQLLVRLIDVTAQRVTIVTFHGAQIDAIESRRRLARLESVFVDDPNSHRLYIAGGDCGEISASLSSVRSASADPQGESEEP